MEFHPDKGTPRHWLFDQWLLGYNFSVAVWVGYIALFGTAVETGVVLVVYLREALDRRLLGTPLRHEDIEPPRSGRRPAAPPETDDGLCCSHQPHSDPVGERNRLRRDETHPRSNPRTGLIEKTPKERFAPDIERTMTLAGVTALLLGAVILCGRNGGLLKG